MTFLWAPDSTSFAPTWRAKGKPEQAAERSKPQAWGAPSLCWTRQAVAGKDMSGVTVATMMTSSSEASMPRRERQILAASKAKSLVATPLSTMWRSRMPVRSVIHWSLVATIFSRSALVSRWGGTKDPTEEILARTGIRGFNVRLKLQPPRAKEQQTASYRVLTARWGTWGYPRR